MKQATKVFIWIGMILQFFLIYPIVVGIFALKKLKEATSKDDLKSMGIITALFCSLIGGICMLNIKDEELVTNKDTQSNTKQLGLYTKRKVLDDTPLDEKLISQRKRMQVKLNIFLLIIICVLLAVSFVFSLIGLVMFEAFIPLIANLIICGIYITILVMFFKNQKALNNKIYILLFIFYFLNIAQIILSGLSVETISYGEYCWTGWVNFGLAIALTVFSILVVILNITINHSLTKKRYKIVVDNNLELELNDIKRLLEEKVVTEEEYNKMRASVIEKYYR